MAFNLAPNPKFQQLDQNGNPLTGGKVYTYLAGSLTPVDTYTDSTGVTANTNPVVLDARGEADIWISDTIAYKFILTDSADVEIWSVDNITTPTGSGGGGGTDELVKVSAADLAAQYLEAKLVGGNKIDITLLGPGSVETLQIALQQLVASDIDNDSTVTGATVKDALETLESDTTDKLDKIDPTAQSVVSEVTFEDTITLNTTASDTPIKTLGRNASNEVIEFDNVVGGGQVDSVVGGTGVTIDNTDPINPIINATASALDLQTAYNNSVDPEILTDTTRGALTLKRGSVADTDNVIEVQNGSGTNTFEVTGDGDTTIGGKVTLDSAASINDIVFDSKDWLHNTAVTIDGAGDIITQAGLITHDEIYNLNENNGIFTGILSSYSGTEFVGNRYVGFNQNETEALFYAGSSGAAVENKLLFYISNSSGAEVNSSTFTAEGIEVSIAPTIGDHLTNKSYVDGLLVGTIQYQGTWDASTNSPALATGVGTQGHYYIVDVAGSTNLDGITDWKVGDWAIFDGTAWGKVDNTNSTVIAGTNIGVVASGNDYTVNVVDNPTFAGDVTIDQTINLTPYVNSTPTINQIWARPNGQRMNGGFGIGVDPVANTISAPNLVLTGDATIGGNIILSGSNAGILGDDDTTSRGFSGGTSLTTGANIVLYGTGGTDEARLRYGTASRAVWDTEGFKILNTPLFVDKDARFNDGVIGSPSITFSNDTDSGWYRVSSGTIAYSSNGVKIIQLSGGSTAVDVTGDLDISGEATIDGGVKVRSNTQASTATLTINSDTTDIETITAQAVALSIANPSGTPDEGQTLKIRIKDNATARTITWSGSEWRAIGVTLPTTTTISKTLYIGAIYNSVDTKWDVVAISEEA